MRDIFVVTHCESRHHVEGLVGGWYDGDLTDRGCRQAEMVARAVKSRVSPQDTRLVSSDLLRARGTGQVIADALGLQMDIDARLREISSGTADGKPQQWLADRIVHPPRTGDRLDHTVIDGAETRRVFASRIYAAMAEVDAMRERHVVIVTHGFAMTFVTAAWLGLPIEHAGYIDLRSEPGGITHLRQAGPFWNKSLQSLSDTRHLSS